MNLSSFFSVESCSASLKARGKDQVIAELAALALRSPGLTNLSGEVLAAALAEREAQGSTGFGDGLAIPHARIPGIEDFVVFIAHCPRGVEFDALDRKKVKVFFVIFGPDDKPSEHVQILAALSRLLSGTTLKAELMAAANTEVMAEAFLRHIDEKADDASAAKKKMKLLVLILYLEDLIYHVLEYFLEEGIEGATVIESSGMGRYVSSIPLFASFIGFINENKTRSNTILATIPADREGEIVKGIETITGDMDRKQGAMLITLDIGLWKGNMKMM